MKKIIAFFSVFSFFLFLVIPSQANAIEVLLADLTLSADCSESKPGELLLGAGIQRSDSQPRSHYIK